MALSGHMSTNEKHSQGFKRGHNASVTLDVKHSSSSSLGKPTTTNFAPPTKEAKQTVHYPLKGKGKVLLILAALFHYFDFISDVLVLTEFYGDETASPPNFL